MSRRGRPGDTPAVLYPPAVLGLLFLALPVVGLLVRAPWSSLRHIYAHSDLHDALRISILTSLSATLASLVLGVPLAWVLARVRLPGMAVVRSIVTMPLVLPPVVGGVALFLAFGRKGFLGQYLHSWFGLDLAFSLRGVVIAEAFVAMPFLVVTMEGAFRQADRHLEEAAATLGASRLRTFTRVTVPLVVPSLVAGLVLCWARAIGEFGATLIFGGNVPGATQTMPTLILDAFQNRPEDAVALSLPLMLIAVVVLAALRDKWLRPVASS
ncbi:MAG TPA: ABC transporter permease [Jatrophihabitantaceae bacterium]|jgi:molybdate transport system permease protein|nr:ABC transporter permease [Jatrophihabitantaceae bacterium]